MYPLKTILIFFLIILTSDNTKGQATAENVKMLKAFQLQTEKWKDAYNSGDAQNLVPLYTTDARYLSSHVTGLELIGREKVIANFQNGMKMGGHIDSVEILTMQSSSELVTLICKYQATNSGQTVSGRNLLVLKKVNGFWLIVIHMTVV
jgi:ketosteroid isomerase-like protein